MQARPRPLPALSLAAALLGTHGRHVLRVRAIGPTGSARPGGEESLLRVRAWATSGAWESPLQILLPTRDHETSGAGR